jgi:hypothetical protein
MVALGDDWAQLFTLNSWTECGVVYELAGVVPRGLASEEGASPAN